MSKAFRAPLATAGVVAVCLLLFLPGSFTAGNGIIYRCPSAADQLTHLHWIDIKPLGPTGYCDHETGECVQGGQPVATENRALWNVRGVWEGCLSGNQRTGLMALGVLVIGLGVGVRRNRQPTSEDS